MANPCGARPYIPVLSIIFREPGEELAIHWMSPMVKQMIIEHLGEPPHDDDSTWPAFGMADFGLPGCFLYGLLFGLLIQGLESFSRRIAKQSLGLAIFSVGMTFFVVTFVDEEPNAILGMYRIIFALYLLSIVYRHIKAVLHIPDNLPIIAPARPAG